MAKHTFFRTLLFALTPLVCGASVTFAQSAASSYRPVFGGASTGSGQGKTIDLTFDVAEVYDQNLTADAGLVSPSAFQVSGFYTLLSPQLRFKSTGDRVQWTAAADSSARYFGQTGNVIVTSYDAGVGLTAQMTARTAVSLSQGVTYAPSYLYGLFAKLAAPGGVELTPQGSSYAVDDARSYSSATTGSLTHHFSPRAAVVFSGSYNATNVTGSNPGYSDLRSNSEGGRFTYSMSRDVTVRLGYTYRESRFSRLYGLNEHDLDIGVDYRRPISPSRKMALSFSLGPRLVETDSTGLESPQTYGVAGNMSLDYQLGRTWTARGTYDRGFSLIEGLLRPAYTDGISANVAGLLNRRTELTMSGSFSKGTLSTGGAASFSTYAGDVRLRHAVGRVVAAYVEYLYYYYDFGTFIQLPTGVPPVLTRNSVRVGVSLWAPLRRQ